MTNLGVDQREFTYKELGVYRLRPESEGMNEKKEIDPQDREAYQETSLGDITNYRKGTYEH